MTAARRCTLPTDAGPCGRVMLADDKGGGFCPVHDRIRCTAPHRGKTCGYRLLNGREQACPQCGVSTKLQDTLKRGGA